MLVVCLALGVSGRATADANVAADADADADGLFAGELLFRPPVEWSTWIRFGYGIEQVRSDRVARGRLSTLDRQGTWDGGIGAEATLPLSVHGNLRIGAWAELRTGEDHAFAGGELVLTRVPRRFEMFLYEGDGILAIRAGRSATSATAAIAYGYLAPWKLEGPCKVRFYDVATGVCAPRPPRATRYMAGVRLVVTATRSIADPRDWSATLGIETEPLGALRMFLARRSWY
jgi:hypothetical protein